MSKHTKHIIIATISMVFLFTLITVFDFILQYNIHLTKKVNALEIEIKKLNRRFGIDSNYCVRESDIIKSDNLHNILKRVNKKRLYANKKKNNYNGTGK